jgi:hypothetical protein
MKIGFIVGLAASAVALAGCAPPGVATVQLGNSVLCGPTEVIMPSQAVTSMRAQFGDAGYGAEVCRAAAGINATGIVDPTPVKVMLPIGETTVRVRQNMRGL